MSFGTRIKQRRQELSLSVEELAGKIGKSRATIYRYENGNIEDMPITVIEPLAKALETTPTYLIGWDETCSSLDDIINALPSACYEDVLSYAKRLLELIRNDCPLPKHSLVENMHSFMCLLNELGQQEAVSRVEELTYLSKYSLSEKVTSIIKISETGNNGFDSGNNGQLIVEYPDTPVLEAAHQWEGATEEDLEHDDAIMKNDNLWRW